MPIQTHARYTARLDVPLSGDPAAHVDIVVDSSGRVDIVVDSSGRSMRFTSSSETSEADAKRKIREFLQAARDAANA